MWPKSQTEKQPPTSQRSVCPMVGPGHCCPFRPLSADSAWGWESDSGLSLRHGATLSCAPQVSASLPPWVLHPKRFCSSPVAPPSAVEVLPPRVQGGQLLPPGAPAAGEGAGERRAHQQRPPPGLLRCVCPECGGQSASGQGWGWGWGCGCLVGGGDVTLYSHPGFLGEADPGGRHTAHQVLQPVAEAEGPGDPAGDQRQRAGTEGWAGLHGRTVLGLSPAQGLWLLP